MEKKFHSENESDRISELPEFIKTHILSYLDTKDVVRTSTLSRCWRALPTWLLDLDLSSYNLSTALTNEWEGFYAFLDRVFESSFEVDKVKLYVPGFGFDLKSRLDHWLDGAVRRRVKELELEIGVRECPRYSFPESSLVVHSITKLKLHKCEMKFLFLMDNLLPSLQELCLEDVCLNSMALESLLGNCIKLKNVTLMNCDGFRRVETSGLTKLEKVTFGHSVHVESIKVDAPNLLEFRYIYDGDSVGNTCEIEIVDFFDSLLWLAPCPESIFISDGDFSASKSIKFLYDERPLKGKKNGGRWKSSNCWQHTLKKVWIENQGRANDDTELVNFFEMERIGGKVECIIKNLKP
uniref:F-box domain-containing protein n=1 Tax=Chenopodium quinoa TaxID=63459 RepID=A0A803NAM2_CHEQI